MNLLQAKLVLYRNLLSIPAERVTDSDLELMELLRNDPNVQAHFDRKVAAGK